MATEPGGAQFPTSGPRAEVIATLAASIASPPPTHLRERVVDALTPRARPARLGTVEAYARTVESMATLLRDLSVADLDARVLTYGWPVRGLIAHLAEVEAYFGGRLGLWDYEVNVDLEADHVGLTLAAVNAACAASDDTDSMATTWIARAQAIVAHLRSLSDEQRTRIITFNILTTRITGVLAARVFEIWTHENDIRHATGRPPCEVEPERLAMMAANAVPAIPLGLLLNKADGAGRTVRVVLTGEGGGTWSQALGFGESAGAPNATIVIDVVDFCRLAAQRIEHADLAVEILGDTVIAELALSGAAVFAA